MAKPKRSWLSMVFANAPHSAGDPSSERPAPAWNPWSLAAFSPPVKPTFWRPSWPDDARSAPQRRSAGRHQPGNPAGQLYAVHGAAGPWHRPGASRSSCLRVAADLRRHPGQSRRPAGLLGRERRRRDPPVPPAPRRQRHAHPPVDDRLGRRQRPAETVSPQPWVVHQYPAAGQYTIMVSATSPDGTFSADSSVGPDHRSSGRHRRHRGDGLQVGMAAMPPTLHVAAAQTVAQGQTFALDNLASFSYPDAVAVTNGVTNDFSYTIDWGDGSAPLHGSNVDVHRAGRHDDGSPFLGALRQRHRRTARSRTSTVTSGTYYLAVTVTADSSGLSDTQTIPINVVELTPTISRACPPTTPAMKATPSTLSASAARRLTDPVAYNWQILDSAANGRPEHRSELSYTFTGPDTYTVSLVATVDAVTSAPATAAITVNDVGPSFVNSTIPDVNASVGQTFTLPPVPFTDPGLSNTHTATIDWADGTDRTTPR